MAGVLSCVLNGFSDLVGVGRAAAPRTTAPRRRAWLARGRGAVVGSVRARSSVVEQAPGDQQDEADGDQDGLGGDADGGFKAPDLGVEGVAFGLDARVGGAAGGEADQDVERWWSRS
ncbi:hypothetical protein ACFYUY_34910 [Kitasatospora sp. NPDC004745]|uniref:hypothetical protein n=1 Tax=Kitasatospora sp. NPDC004745 TaxID=3364019 RepID=UPI00368129B6